MKTSSAIRHLKTPLLLSFLTLTCYAVDEDGDGMSDVWQRVHNIATGDGSSDPDGDGKTNAIEALSGTDPHDPTDFFKVTTFTINPPFDTLDITWRSLESRTYRIEESRDLLNWTLMTNASGGQGLLTSQNVTLPSPPSNDNFESRLPTVSTGTQTTGSNVDASSENNEPQNPSVAGAKSVWWTWKASSAGEVTITTVGSDYDTTLAVYSGESLATLALIGSNDDGAGLGVQSSVTFTADPALVYSFQVNGYSGATGSIILNHPASAGTFPQPVIPSVQPERIFFRVDGDTNSDLDQDGDSLLTWEERLLGTDPYDSDGDTDNDGMGDLFEFIYEFDPLSAADATLDADNDGLTNAQEAPSKGKLNPRLSDTNGNGISDADEDSDFDGLTNAQELQIYLTDPFQPDTDLDGLFDGWEILNDFSALISNLTDSDPNNDPTADPDNDGLTNSQEADHGTKANDPDSDGDGVSDGDEVTQGSNPNDPNDSSPPPNGTVPVNITFGDPSGSNSEKYRIALIPLEGDNTGHAQRFRTNRQYGTPQTDTFHLPKGSKYRVELVHVGTDPNYNSEPNPDYDYQLDFDTSQGCLVLDDPEGIHGNHNEGASFYAEGKSATLYMSLFKTKEVSFSNSTIPGWITSDDVAITYDAPHWQDGNDDGDADDVGERKYPIAYVRNTPPSIAGKITVKPSGLTSVSGFSVNIKVTGPGSIAIPSTAATLGTNELELPVTASSGNFLNEIDYLNPMTLTWEVQVNGGSEWCEAGVTKHRTYVTLSKPSQMLDWNGNPIILRQETLFDIGCRNADGETTAQNATAKIWSEFTDRVVRKVNPSTGLPDGTQMTYYSSYDPRDAQGNPVCTAPQLLKANDGQCGSWADLLIRIRQIQGIDDPDEYVIFGPINGNEGFAIKNWNFAAIGTSGNPTYPYLNICPLGNGSVNANYNAVRGQASYNWAYAEVSDGFGIAGQGNQNPASLFGNHQVMLSGEFYDPSYGIKHASLPAIDSNAIDGFFILSTENLDEATYNLDLNSDGDKTDIGVPTACYLF